MLVDLRRFPAIGGGGGGVGVTALGIGVDGIGESSGILSAFSSSSWLRRPRHRLALGGSGLTFGLGLAPGCTNSVSGGRSARLGVMTPGFSCWDATSRTLKEDVEAGSRCIPSRFTALSLRWWCRTSGEPGACWWPVGDAVSLSELLLDEVICDASRGSPVVAKTDPVRDAACDSTSGSTSRSHSTVAQRITNRFVVSSTSSKCWIFSSSVSCPES